MIALRSAAFNAFFFGSTFLLTFPATALRLWAPDRLMGFARWWARVQIGALRVLCGIKLEVTGLEHVPAGAALITPRHESAFDILAWIAVAPRPCFVVKQELTRIPLFGQLIVAIGMICVDRGAGSAAMRTLLRGADRAVAEGRQIIIFPEGTRADPGERPPLQPGAAALAARTGLPVIPVMTDSGMCWGRRSFGKRPGTIHIAIRPPIAGLSGRDAVAAALRRAFDAGVG